MMELQPARPVAEHAKTDPPLRILVLHQHYWPEIAATAQILADVCEDLAKQGHSVTVLCGHPSYRNTSRQSSPVVEQHAGVTIKRVWSYNPSVRSIPRRLLHYGTYFANSLVKAATESKPDVCLVLSTPPLLLGVSGVVLRALRGVPFVYSVQDLYPDIAVHLGVLRDGAVLTKAIGTASSFTYRSATSVVTLSEGMSDALKRKGVREDRLHVISNWADVSAVVPTARDNEFAREHGLIDKFVVQYSGNIGLSQGLESVIEAARLLRDLPIKFALVGDGNAKTELQSLAARHNLENVVFIPPQPRARLSNVLSSCDVGLVTMRRGVAGDLVPSKLYGILAAAKPVLASVELDSEVARIMSKNSVGWLCAPEEPSALANSIRAAYQSPPGALQTLGQSGRELCIRDFSRNGATRRYEAVLHSAVRTSRTQSR